MTKFRSLLFRELRIARRTDLLMTLLIIGFCLFYIIGVYAVKNDAAAGETMVLDIVTLASMMIGFISVMSVLNYEILKSDLNTNWLAYSYTLPIQPKDRALVNVVIKCGMALAFMAVGLVFTDIYCAIGEIPFSAAFVTVYVVIFACGMLYAVIYDAVIYRARSIAQMKKLEQRLGLGMLGLFIIIGAIFSGKIKHILSSDNGVPAEKLLDILNGKMLLWLIPLCAVLIIADYLAIKNSMQSAYSVVNEKKKTQIQEKEIISDAHDYPTGFLYKEMKQNRLVIVLTALTPILLLILNYMMLYFVKITAEEKLTFPQVMTDAENRIVRYLCIVLGAYMASGLMCGIFGGDDRKLWAYFTVSTPQGVRGSLYYKYVLAFAMNGIFMVSSVFADNIYDTVYYAVTGKENSSLNSLFLILFLALLAICAFDIPFMIRFGQKKGSYIKTSLMLGISTVLVVLFGFLPEAVTERIMQFFSDLKDGKANDTVMIVISFVPALCLAAYVLSYKFSCKLFMKGLEE